MTNLLSSRLRACAVYCVALIACTAAANRSLANVIGGFDSARGGANSLLDNQPVLQAAVSSMIPGVTFSSTSTLTPGYLSTLRGIYIGSSYSVNTAIGALSPAEQAALYQFVLDGGGAIIGTDNIHQSINGDAPAVQTSLLGPFGLHETGDSAVDFPGHEGATVVNANHPVTNGPYGPVVAFPTNRYGWYDNLGPYATGLAVGTHNGQPLLAVIERGALGPGSGPVVFFSDLNLTDFAASSPDTANLFLNTLHFAYVPEPSALTLAVAGVLCACGIALRKRVPGRWLRRSCVAGIFLTCLVAGLPAAWGGSIGVNFATDGLAATIDLAGGDVTGVVPQPNWNNAHQSDASLTNLVDNANLPTGTKATWAHFPLTTAQVSTTTPIGKLMRGAINLNGNGGGGGSVVVTQIPYARYDVYLYFTSTASSDYSIYNAANTPGPYNTAASAVPTYFPDGLFHEGGAGNFGNFLHFASLGGPTLFITGAQDPFVQVPLSGFQVVEVPEPSTLALAVMAAGACLWTWRRHRK